MVTQLEVKPQLETIVVEKEPVLDLVIIGGGPAGLSAALYALRYRLKTLLIEKMVLGGLVSTTFEIENYPGIPESIAGMKLAQQMQAQVEKLGLEILWGNVIHLKPGKNYQAIESDGKVIMSKTIIIATGTEAKKLGVPGEDKFRGRGVSYCATCDGPFYQGKNIMVVGGGNSAIEEALFLTRYASKVSIVHRRDTLRADKVFAERATAHPKTYFFWHTVVEEICGKNRVEEVILKDRQSEKKIKVPVDGVFIYVGSKPHTEFVKNVMTLDENGFIPTDENMKTSVPGIFAAGDVRKKELRQVVTAVADGALAANSVRKYLEKLESSAIL